MRIMGFLRADEQTEAGVPPTPELMERMDAFVNEVTEAGVIESTDGLTPSSAGKRISLTDGKWNTVDGPFGDPRQLVSAYCIYNVKSWDDAVHWTKRFLEVLGGGECELRPFFDPAAFEAGS